MSRTKKDLPYRVTGVWTHRYSVSPTGHAKWKRSIRKKLRARQKHDLKVRGDVMPDYPLAHEYFD